MGSQSLQKPVSPKRVVVSKRALLYVPKYQMPYSADNDCGSPNSETTSDNHLYGTISSKVLEPLLTTGQANLAMLRHQDLQVVAGEVDIGFYQFFRWPLPWEGSTSFASIGNSTFVKPSRDTSGHVHIQVCIYGAALTSPTPLPPAQRWRV